MIQKFMKQNQCCRCTCTCQFPKSAISEGQGLIWLWDGFCRKDNWEQMGTYDINMTEWGGEHIEVEKNLDGELHGNLLVRWESERYRCRSNQGEHDVYPKMPKHCERYPQRSSNIISEPAWAQISASTILQIWVIRVIPLTNPYLVAHPT